MNSASSTSPNRRPNRDPRLTAQLFDAAKTGDTPLMRSLVFDQLADPNVVDEDGMTPLHLSIVEGSFHCALVLIESGLCDYLVKTKKGKYPSELALTWSNPDTNLRYGLAEQLMRLELAQGQKENRPSW